MELRQQFPSPVYTWHAEAIPPHLPVRQVWGFCFDNEGRLLLRESLGVYGLPGGKPEPFDTSWSATLNREAQEEVQITIKDATYVGYQTVEEPHTPMYGQVRMCALIETIKESAPDLDSGRHFTRWLVSPTRAITLLKWTQGAEQITAVALLARETWGLPTLEGGEIDERI